MELRVCKYITDLQAWQTKIEKRHAAGKALTKAQDKAYEAWKHSLVQRLVFCKKRQSLVTEARHINKDCIALDLRLSEDPNHLMVSSVNGDDYKLVLLKGGAVEGPCRALPSELDCPLSKQQVETMQAEEEENAVDSHGEQGEEQNLWDDEAGDHMIEDQRYEQECPQIDPNDFAVLADSDEELEDIEFPGGRPPAEPEHLKKVKSFFHRPAWRKLQALNLTDLPKHIKGVSIGCHQTSQQWQGFYPKGDRHVCLLPMSGTWGGRSRLSEEECILQVIRGILENHLQQYPKDRLWKTQLDRVVSAQCTKAF